MRKGLVIIDVQNDYFSDGKMALVGMEKAAENCRRLLTYFRVQQFPIFHIRHMAASKSATFLLPDTPGSEIHEQVTPIGDEPVVEKRFPNAFRDTLLKDLLFRSGINELIICGAMSHMCVDTTVRAAYDLGFNSTLIADACATRDLEFGKTTVKAVDVHTAFMAALDGTFAKVLNLIDYLK